MATRWWRWPRRSAGRSPITRPGCWPRCGRRRTDRPEEYAADEVRLALTLTRRAADALLGVAFELLERVPAAHAALRSGMIDLPRARVLEEETAAPAGGAAGCRPGAAGR